MTKPKQAPVASASQTMDKFFTRKAHNEGIKLPLILPSGEETEHWLRIRGIDSDVFKAANAEVKRKMLMKAQDVLEKGGPDAKAAFSDTEREEGRLEVLASLVITWSFEAPCEKENIMNFLREAPQIASKIDELAGNRRLFFLTSSNSSTLSQSQSSV